MAALTTAEVMSSIEYATPAWRRQLVYLASVQDHDLTVEADSDHAFGKYDGADYDDHTVQAPTNVQPERELNGDWLNEAGAAPEWYEAVHVRPAPLDFGLVTSTTQRELSIYNAYRRTAKSWSAFTNNAGEGTDLIGEPSLTYSVSPFSDIDGVFFQVTADGDAVVVSDIVFDWTSGESISVPVLITRVIPIATKRGGVLIPEAGITETLEFLTDIIVKGDGTAQAVSLRENPRQTFDMSFKLDEGFARAELDLMLAANQHRVFAVPYWPGEVALTADVAAAATTLSVGTTTYKDFRDTSSVLIFEEGSETYDVIGIDSVSANSITLSAPLANSYSAGARVLPIIPATLSSNLSGSRYPVNLGELELRFESYGPGVDLASTAAFSSYNSKVLLDDYNSVRGRTPWGFVRRIFVLDSGSGRRAHRSSWLLSSPSEEKAIIAQGAQAIHEARQLMHALRGRQVTFYLPTFRDDLEVVDDMVNGGSELTITWCGYTETANALAPWNHIRITLTDGTTYEREITASAEPDATQTSEILTLGSTWPTDITVEEVQRVEFLKPMRFATDTITIEHDVNNRSARISAPVEGAL